MEMRYLRSFLYTSPVRVGCVVTLFELEAELTGAGTGADVRRGAVAKAPAVVAVHQVIGVTQRAGDHFA